MANNEIEKCGIVMPISPIAGCSEGHWGDVLRIISESIIEAGFAGNLVSNADDVGIIHKRIIQNLYENPIVVVDVSGKNPNVMFELGLRLAFDKPTIIIKDDKTSYSFDTSSIEHLEYPRDLRFSRIVEFKEKLSEKIAATHKRATTDPNYTTFLKHFGEFTVAKLNRKEVSGQEFIIEELQSMRRAIGRIEIGRKTSFGQGNRDRTTDIDLCARGVSGAMIKNAFEHLMNHQGTRNVGMSELDADHYHFVADFKGSSMAQIELENEVRALMNKPNKRVRRRAPSSTESES